MASLPYPLNRLDNHGWVSMASLPYSPTDCHSYLKINMNIYLLNYITLYFLLLAYRTEPNRFLNVLSLFISISFAFAIILTKAIWIMKAPFKAMSDSFEIRNILKHEAADVYARKQKYLNSATLWFNFIYKFLSNKKLLRILPCQIFHLS